MGGWVGAGDRWVGGRVGKRTYHTQGSEGAELLELIGDRDVLNRLLGAGHGLDGALELGGGLLI